MPCKSIALEGMKQKGNLRDLCGAMLATKTPLKKETHIHFLGKLIYIQGDIRHKKVITYKKGVYSETCREVQGQPFRKDSKIAQIGSVFY